MASLPYKKQLAIFMVIGGLVAAALIIVPSALVVYNTSYTFSEFTVADKSAESTFYLHMHPESALYLNKPDYDQIVIGDTCNLTRAKGQYVTEWREASMVCNRTVLATWKLIEKGEV